jgi:hypothetical protein
MKLIKYPTIPCEKSKKQKICDSMAERIKKDRKNGMKLGDIMKKYNINSTTVYRITIPGFREKQNELVNTRNYWRYHNDPEFRKSHITQTTKNHADRYKNDIKYRKYSDQIAAISNARRFKTSKWHNLGKNER